jgi:hypothetical protein
MSPDKPKPRVLLMELELRRSEKTGRAWGSGFLGRSRVIAFEHDAPNPRGHRFLKVFVEEYEPKGQRPAPEGSRPRALAEALDRREQAQRRGLEGDPSDDPPF